LALSIIGDTGDDIYGIPGIGPKGFIKVIDEFIKIFGNMKNIYDKIEKGEDLFKDIETENKILNIIIEEENKNKRLSNNLKLVSFELLSRALDSPNNTEMIEKKKHIENIMKTSNITRRESMISALERNGVFLEGTSIDFIYI
jgi:5'-3' exonuclease